MLHDVKDLQGFAVGATDGELGTVTDLYFDDQRWTIRYLVIETGGWFSARKVLISPSAIRRVAWDSRIIAVSLSRQQIKDSPSIDTDKPVSRQYEIDYYDYYGYPYYWEGVYAGGPFTYPVSSVEASADSASASRAPRRGEGADGGERDGEGEGERTRADSHLRSSNDVTGHEAMASDGPVGNVQSFVFDDASWAIRHLIVSTGKWLPGKHVRCHPGNYSVSAGSSARCTWI
jgi:uncharacterized protein YrrD